MNEERNRKGNVEALTASGRHSGDIRIVVWHDLTYRRVRGDHR